VGYILETFPIVKRNDEQAHGEYHTKRVILDIYDAMQQAMETGIPYHARLDPPPANGWTPLDVTLEVVTGVTEGRGKERYSSEFICRFSTACGAYSVPAQIEFRYYCIKWPDGQTYMNLR
jgi:hypothetical protein